MRSGTGLSQFLRMFLLTHSNGIKLVFTFLSQASRSSREKLSLVLFCFECRLYCVPFGCLGIMLQLTMSFSDHCLLVFSLYSFVPVFVSRRR